jgi:hypothetical protein
MGSAAVSNALRTEDDVAMPLYARLVPAGLALGLFLLLPVQSAQAAPEPKIPYCHRTSAVTNPYVAHTSDANSIIKAGHGDHTGPVFPETGPDGRWGDIIPPFDYSGGHYNGLNWNPAGETVLAGGCAVYVEPPPPTTTTTTTTTTAPPVTESSTTATTAPAPTTEASSSSTEPTTGPTSTDAGAVTTTPSGSTTTTVPQTTTTVTLPGFPPSTAFPPPLVDPGAGVDIMPPHVAIVILFPNVRIQRTPPRFARQERIVILGALNPQLRRRLRAELRLAFTGSSDTPGLIFAALVLILTGGALIGSARRRTTS